MIKQKHYGDNDYRPNGTPIPNVSWVTPFLDDAGIEWDAILEPNREGGFGGHNGRVVLFPLADKNYIELDYYEVNRWSWKVRLLKNDGFHTWTLNHYFTSNSGLAGAKQVAKFLKDGCSCHRCRRLQKDETHG